MLYLLPASDRRAIVHLKKTILNKVHIEPYLDLLEPEKRKTLDGMERLNVWGVKKGERLSKAWEELPIGAKTLIYSEGRYVYAATVFEKVRNEILAEKIWGLDSDGLTWEHLLFLEDVTPVKIDRLEFNALFGYKGNHYPQGFKKVSEDRLGERLKIHGTIDDILLLLNKGIPVSEEALDIEADYHSEINERRGNSKKYETDSDKAPSKKTKKALRKSIYVLAWERDVNVARRALSNASYRCEIAPEHLTFQVKKSGHQFMEAHHLIPMREQYHIVHNIDVVSNVVSLCPNCHRKIHHADSETKKSMLRGLYKSRQEALHEEGLSFTFEELLNFYSITD